MSIFPSGNELTITDTWGFSSFNRWAIREKLFFVFEIKILCQLRLLPFQFRIQISVMPVHCQVLRKDLLTNCHWRVHNRLGIASGLGRARGFLAHLELDDFVF